MSEKGRPKGEHRSARGGGRAIAVVALLALHALSTGCGMGREPTSRTLTLTECRLPRLSVAAQCGELPVPENRDRPEGRRIGIFVAVLPANTVAPKADPLIILAGGPGQAASRLAPSTSSSACSRECQTSRGTAICGGATPSSTMLRTRSGWRRR